MQADRVVCSNISLRSYRVYCVLTCRRLPPPQAAQALMELASGSGSGSGPSGSEGVAAVRKPRTAAPAPGRSRGLPPKPKKPAAAPRAVRPATAAAPAPAPARAASAGQASAGGSRGAASGASGSVASGSGATASKRAKAGPKKGPNGVRLPGQVGSHGTCVQPYRHAVSSTSGGAARQSAVTVLRVCVVLIDVPPGCAASCHVARTHLLGQALHTPPVQLQYA